MENSDKVINDPEKEGPRATVNLSTAFQPSMDIPKNYKSTPEILNMLIKSEKLEKDSDKMTIYLKAAGNAPILKNNKIKLSGNVKLVTLISYLKDQFKALIKENESLFIYCNSNFSPSPTEYIRDLFNNFAIQGELIITYALSEAWG